MKSTTPNHGNVARWLRGNPTPTKTKWAKHATARNQFPDEDEPSMNVFP
jgi:hypothetical protein